ncbi:hypothetical protein QFC20_007056 [Naganishia adeliensis]|uniref:Uncharacterized protein n=1 Tax=Naganishia adeliensis TaxID=92952 RepID=A0ACC2V442_9TREE|nr:hypothetical protein QFC20_007056 [Naganishia adeliensis]
MSSRLSSPSNGPGTPGVDVETPEPTVGSVSSQVYSNPPLGGSEETLVPIETAELLKECFPKFHFEINRTYHPYAVGEGAGNHLLGYLLQLARAEASTAEEVAKRLICVFFCYYMLRAGGYGNHQARHTEWAFDESSTSKSLYNWTKGDLLAYGKAYIKDFKDYPKQSKKVWKELKDDWKKVKNLLEHCYD